MSEFMLMKEYYYLGHYCPEGSHEPIRCQSGFYQDETGKGSCKTCVQGFYCDNTKDPVVLYNNSHCPEGHYCPAGEHNFYSSFKRDNSLY